MRTRFILLLCLCILLFSFFIGDSVYSKEKSIKYIPRDESMDIVAKNLGITVNESACPPLDAVIKELSFCQNCVSWSSQCPPGCCLKKVNKKWVIQCTPQDDSKYKCNPVGFLVNSCSRVDCGQYKPDCAGNPSAIPSCQSKGCPDPAVDGKLNKNGYYDSNNLLPKFTGCEPNPAASLSKCSTPYYIVTPVYGKPPVKEFLGYSYDVTADFSKCIDDCHKYADAYEQCVYGTYCCRSNLCQQQGYDKACDQASCEELVANQTCENYDAGSCNKLQSKVTDCLMAGASGDCYSCFKEIETDPPTDPPLLYKFVSRSREKIVVAWQVTASPVNAGDAKSYFYTQVKVFDDATGNPVHESFVTQKSLSGSFTIFSATAVDKKIVDGKEVYVLEPGRAYTIKPYYYLPNVKQGLSVRIEQVQLIIIRIRE